MESTQHQYTRNTCGTHYHGNGFFIFPILILVLIFSRGVFWPIFLVFLIIFLVSQPNRRSRRYYRAQAYNQQPISNSSPRYVTKAEVNFCKNCGTKIEADSVYCQECGFKLF